MRQILLITAVVVLAVTLVVGAFTVKQAASEQANLSSDLQYRTRVLADSLLESLEPSLRSGATSTIQRTVDKFADRERLVGLGVYKADGRIVAASAGLPENVRKGELAAEAMDTDDSAGDFNESGARYIYVFAQPMRDDGAVVGALVIVQSADYIVASVRSIWISNILRLAFQLTVFAAAMFVLVRFVIRRPLRELERLVRSARTGEDIVDAPHYSFFSPLSKEISKIGRSLKQARATASQEARLRLEKIDTPWTAERLKEFTRAYLKDRPIYVVSNREPYIHTKARGTIQWSVPASGMVTALEPVMEATGGVWLAHGSGDADRETADADGRLEVPPDEPRYTLKRIFLSDEEVKGHYNGFSNEALWPMCHNAHTRPIFRHEDWIQYRKVNGTFAAALLREIKDDQRPLILVQDYHFALLPSLIKASRPDVNIAIFWHIPWPSAEAFSICPWRTDILEGMLGADLIGFHTQAYCNNFLETVGKEVESLIDYERFAVTRERHTSFVEAFPISIAFSHDEDDIRPSRDALKQLGVHTKLVGLGVDRLDYTKGIVERFKSLEFLFERHTEYIGKFTLLQIAPPSREAVEKYREYNDQVSSEAERINERFGTRNWKPIVLRKEHFDHDRLRVLYRLADVCLVTSLHDGMNLVAKEFVAARTDESGVLILSPFTGAARDLKGAIIVNPYSAEQGADAIHQALTMPKVEQHRRMKQMRESVRSYNVYRWSAEMIKSLAQLN